MLQTDIFKDKDILVGITGGIAAYKTLELIRHLITAGARPHVCITRNTLHFVTTTTLETLSQRPVMHEMFPGEEFSGTHHINIADKADVAIITPATYNFIGKLNSGIADDLLLTIIAALKCPLVIAPAMNMNMWHNVILQRNLNSLQNLDMLICPPEEGFLAEGYSGMGRLAPLHHQIQFLYKALHPEKKSLAGKKVLITAGRTEEEIDPVRVITNKSSGKMGFALAWEAFSRGAEVTLVHGPTELESPVQINSIQVNSAAEMADAVFKKFEKTDFFISAAAVADFKVKYPSASKIKKENADNILQLEKTVDILKSVSKKKKSGQVIMGFAVETDNAAKNALKKLDEKNMDFVVLNNPFDKGAGFYKDTNQVTIFARGGASLKTEILPKLDAAKKIFDFTLKNLFK